jgi:hypothetical protein
MPKYPRNDPIHVDELDALTKPPVCSIRRFDRFLTLNAIKNKEMVRTMDRSGQRNIFTMCSTTRMLADD